ncbi:hypothetical protein AYI68_g2454 [Smittium mucronatum]|uniref:Uncharacterized protein n=1 Tax=Smittium mucronatum TaxID=133383 RepID=A0A1R0H2L1_9FUNG|nr:hypothetical protein AYI68_g2454 [Smittium mucronatum]
MKFTLSGLILAGSSLFTVLASPLVDNEVQGEEFDTISKRSGFSNSRRSGSQGNTSRYYKNGRYWNFDSSSDSSFITTLVYRPSVYYGQRFQFLYQLSPQFQQYWNSNSLFRSSWNSDVNFRNSWFATIYPYGYTQYRSGGKYYGYYNRGSWKTGNNNSNNRNGGSNGNRGNSGNSGNNRGNWGNGGSSGGNGGNNGGNWGNSGNTGGNGGNNGGNWGNGGNNGNTGGVTGNPNRPRK